MERNTTAGDTVQAFCRSWFEERDEEAAARFLSEDVDFVGTGRDEFAFGLGEMKEYIRQDIREILEPLPAA